jgi:hypothetical protein
MIPTSSPTLSENIHHQTKKTMKQTPKTNPPKPDAIPSYPEHLRTTEAQLSQLLLLLQKLCDDLTARLSSFEARWGEELALLEKKINYLIDLLQKSSGPGA